MAAQSGQVFYTFFYTAGWDRLVRSGMHRHVECAKSLLRDPGPLARDGE
jgi:hypothetical protein